MIYFEVHDDDASSEIGDLAFVIVRASTGVMWRVQYGGHKCIQGSTEGYLVPVYFGTARFALASLFVNELAMSGVSKSGLSEKQLGVVASAVAKIAFTPPTSGDLQEYREVGPVPLRLDRERVNEIDEAWIPVVSGAGSGILTWPNSD